MSPSPDEKGALEAILGHPVDAVLAPAEDGGARVAISRTGDPPRMRAAWVDASGAVTARIGCPPGVPSATRPVVGAIVDVSADGLSDHLILGRVTRGVESVRAIVAGPDPIDLPVLADGIVAARIPHDVHLVALDAIAPGGEAIGRLMRTGLTEMALVAGRVEGRLGSGHGMAAGFGAGDTVPDLATAELEAGYGALLPSWIPEGLPMSTVRVEPEASYPYAPPSIAIAWAGPGDDARVLLRQCPGPLAVPEIADGGAGVVDVNGAPGVIRGRRTAFLVWEAADRAFGLQVRGTEDPAADALRVARSVPAPSAGIA